MNNKKICDIKKKLHNKFINEKYFVYKKNIKKNEKYDLKIPLDKINLYTIHSLNDIEKLLSKGYNFNNFYKIENLVKGINKKSMLFCIFINKEIAHTSWCALSKDSVVFDPLFKQLNLEKFAYIGPCNTNLKFRGLGLYPYTLITICNYLRKIGINNVLINTSKKNLSSQKGILKSGFIRCGHVRYLRILSFEHWSKLKKI